MHNQTYRILLILSAAMLFSCSALKKSSGPTKNASADAIIWASLQIGIYLIFGATQMMQAYMFVKTECAQRITRKIDELQRFLNKFGAKNKDTVSKFTDTVS